MVDDEQLSAMVMQMFLEELGHTVRIASSPQEAIECASDLNPSVLVTDHLLGSGMNGIQLAERIRADHPELRTFLVSGLPRDRLQEELDAAAGIRCFTKPVDLDELAEAIRRG